MSLPDCYRCGCQPCECKDGITLYHADCREVLPELGAGSVDLVCTDPPYGLEFMGKDWDKGVPGMHFWELIGTACKPGAMLASFGGTRTYHRLTCAIEDAGWEVRDCLMWLYGSGFPKSLDLSKAIDKAAGAEREVVGANPTYRKDQVDATSWTLQRNPDITAPATPAAKLWDGYGTSLKPAYEPIVLAMKPLDGTFAENAIEHRVAGLNVDGGRISTGDNLGGGAYSGGKRPNDFMGGGLYRKQPEDYEQPSGRWPANVILQHHEECVCVGEKRVKATGSDVSGNEPSKPTKDIYGQFKDRKAFKAHADADGLETVEEWRCHEDCPIGILDRQSGVSQSQVGQPRQSAKPGNGYGMTHTGAEYSDRGSASRFFYCAKASGKDRGNLPAESLPLFNESVDEFRNDHPTVKPLEVMRWLLTLLFPPSPAAVCLDPFAGSGTTGRACKDLGRKCIMIEIEERYCEIAANRLRQKVLF